MIDKERLQQLIEQEATITSAARKLAEELNIEYNDSFRRRCSKLVAKEGDEDLDNVTKTKENNYPNKKEKVQKGLTATNDLGQLMNIEDYCKYYGLDVSKIRSYKLISHTGQPFYNVVFFTEGESAVLDVDKHLEEIIYKYIEPIKLNTQYSPPRNEDYFDRLVYTDTHIAMDVNGTDGDPLYEGKWDKEEILSRLTTMVSHIKAFQTSDILIIDDLGDFMDGLGGQTTRKGHELPQNMNDKEAFDLALQFKISLVDSLVGDYNTIICNNITNDNHSGVFSYFVSSAVKQILEQRYPDKVRVNSIKKFMHHYSIGKHTFVISHGKDIGENRYGLKPKLDAQQSQKIDQYCKEHKLYNGNFIEFSKGDSHQALYDDTTSSDFQYYNYPAFSPPSNWVKTNFSNSKSGFRFYNIHKEQDIKIAIPYWFKK